MAEDYYNVLGVSKDSPQEEIKKAYKTLAKKYHPDVSKEEGAEEQLKKINEAYSVLSDKEKRQQYDAFGSAEAYQQANQGAGFSGFSGFSGSSRGFGFDFSDIFSKVMDDDFSEFSNFSGFSDFSGFGKGNRFSRKNLNIKKALEIDFMTALKGGKIEISLTADKDCEYCSGTGSTSQKKVVCPTCNGRGQTVSSKRTPFGVFSVQKTCSNCEGSGEVVEDSCSYCKGKGYVNKKSNVSVNIPAGIDNNDVIRLQGLGNRHGNYKGDIFLHIIVKPHDFFKRDGSDIYCEVPITYSDLVLGTTIKIKLLKDTVNLKIPSQTQPQTIFKIKGKGAHNIRNNYHGDLYIKVKVIVPKKISKDYKKTLKELNKQEQKTIKKQISEKYKDYLVE